jgi:hypothetical protein
MQAREVLIVIKISAAKSEERIKELSKIGYNSSKAIIV